MLTLEEQIERIADVATAASVRHDAASDVKPSKTWFRPQRWVGVAAAVMVVGLVGILAAVVAGRDRPAGNSDESPPVVSLPAALSEVDSLDESEWVVATQLPDEYEYLYPLDPSLAGEPGSKVVWYGSRRPDRASEQLRVSAGVDDLAESGESVEVSGVSWTMSESGAGWRATRSVGADIVAVGAPGVFDDSAQALLSGLVVIPESALPSLPLGPRERAVKVATTEFNGVTVDLAVQESNGFACTWVLTSDGGGSGGCGSLVDSAALLTIDGGYGEQVDGADVAQAVSGGSVTEDAVRVDVEFVDGTVVAVTPGDLSGQFDHNFWFAAANVGPDVTTGRAAGDEPVAEVRAYDANGQLLATQRRP